MPTTSSALTLVANNDAMVDSAKPNDNYGGSESLNIFRNGQSAQQAYAKFDLEALYQDAVITKATFIALSGFLVANVNRNLNVSATT